jgi:hypothetical protein
VSLLVVVAVTTALLGTPHSQIEFTFLVVLDVFFSVIVCGLTVVSAYVLKRRIPDEEVPFKAPGGRPMHNIMVGLCLFFCVAMLLLNGADYFVGGFIVILLIPIFYAVTKRVFGGATVNEPTVYPIDPRTKLGFGDLKRIGGYFIGFGVFGVFGRFFLAWYEGDWGPEYYEMEYETGFFANWDGMLCAILLLGVAAIAAGALLFLIGKRLAADDARLRARASAKSA